MDLSISCFAQHSSLLRNLLHFEEYKELVMRDIIKDVSVATTISPDFPWDELLSHVMTSEYISFTEYSSDMLLGGHILQFECVVDDMLRLALDGPDIFKLALDNPDKLKLALDNPDNLELALSNADNLRLALDNADRLRRELNNADNFELALYLDGELKTCTRQS